MVTAPVTEMLLLNPVRVRPSSKDVLLAAISAAGLMAPEL
jgi:hypothetical protein